MFDVFLADTSPTSIYTLSLHDALPIYVTCKRTAGFIKNRRCRRDGVESLESDGRAGRPAYGDGQAVQRLLWRASSDRKSTRLNSSHVSISYAVFCLKKKRELT